MRNDGLTLEECVKGLLSFKNDIGKLSPTQMEAYNKLLGHFKNTHKSAYSSSSDKGSSLENLVSFLLGNVGIFKVYRNIHTSSNEIDQLVSLNFIGEYFKKQGLLNLPDDIILGECKNYNRTIGATWVGKFYSLLTVSNSKFGIIFSYYGLSGKGWEDGIGLTKKLYMLKEHQDEKIIILDFSLADFEEISNGKNFLQVIEDKILSVRTDTDVACFVSKHPGECDFIG